jgi:hypothetical protein
MISKLLCPTNRQERRRVAKKESLHGDFFADPAEPTMGFAVMQFG